MSEKDNETIAVIIGLAFLFSLVFGPVATFFEKKHGSDLHEKKQVVEQKWADKAATKKLEIANSLKVADQLLNN